MRGDSVLKAEMERRRAKEEEEAAERARQEEAAAEEAQKRWEENWNGATVEAMHSLERRALREEVAKAGMSVTMGVREERKREEKEGLAALQLARQVLDEKHAHILRYGADDDSD